MKDIMFNIAVPVMTKQKFSEHTGIEKLALDRMIKLGLIPVIPISERIVLINLALLTNNSLIVANNTDPTIGSNQT